MVGGSQQPIMRRRELRRQRADFATVVHGIGGRVLLPLQHQTIKVGKERAGVVGAWACFRVMLHAECQRVLGDHPFDGAVVHRLVCETLQPAGSVVASTANP